ncbi:MAG TPA: hypothetical protein VKX41_12890 [Alloacidobacterium sp.]|jgi:hypothetical protein|nr:hypothetical protein [Alloacidobacterium sp.]
MRTTITLDPDVEQLLKSALKKGDLTFKQVVNDAIRIGLKGAPAKAKRFRQRTFRMGPMGSNWDKALSMAFALEDEATIRKMAQDK